jgi:hypothetical protein
VGHHNLGDSVTLTLRWNHPLAATARSQIGVAAAKGVTRSDGDFGAGDTY